MDTDPSRSDQNPIPIAVFAPLFPPAYKGGGPIRTLEALVAATPPRFDVSVIAGDREANEPTRLPVTSNTWTDFERSSVYYVSADSIRSLLRGFASLRRTAPTLLYLNSFFDLKLSILPQLLWRVGFWRRANRLVAPRGEFGVAALGRRSRKKRLFIFAYRALGLSSGVTWDASSTSEEADIRALWGNGNRIIVRPNETNLPSEAMPVPPSNASSALRAVFLGRLVEHKGLSILLAALQKVAYPVELDVYGPEEDAGYIEMCRDMASKLPQNIKVRFNGLLAPDGVRSTLNAHDVLLMPTAGENFGHVIAEALSASCPVLCTPTTPWSDILAAGGGVVVRDRTPVQRTQEIESFAKLGAESLVDRRKSAGRAYAQWRTCQGGPHVFELWLREEVKT